MFISKVAENVRDLATTYESFDGHFVLNVSLVHG